AMPFLYDREISSLPGIHGLHLSDLVARWKVPPEKLFEDTGLSRAALSQPQSRLSVATMERLIERARALTGEPALGVYFGLQMRISWHGYLGLAAMTAENGRQALELIPRFALTRTDALTFCIDNEGPTVALILCERADFGAARDAVILALLI